MIGYKAPSTTATETNPFVVATPRSKLPAKSAPPIRIKIGRFFTFNPPTDLKRANKKSATIKVVKRIVVMVIRALVAEPFAIKATAPPKPQAAITAKIIGLTANPPLISGPLAHTAPINATDIPMI